MTHEEMQESQIGAGDFSIVPRFPVQALWNAPITDRGINPIDTVLNESRRVLDSIFEGRSEEEKDHIEEKVIDPIFDEFWNVEGGSDEERLQRFEPTGEYYKDYMEKLMGRLYQQQQSPIPANVFVPSGIEELSDEENQRVANLRFTPLATREEFDVAPVPVGINQNEDLSYIHQLAQHPVILEWEQEHGRPIDSETLEEFLKWEHLAMEERQSPLRDVTSAKETYEEALKVTPNILFVVITPYHWINERFVNIFGVDRVVYVDQAKGVNEKVIKRFKEVVMRTIAKT